MDKFSVSICLVISPLPLISSSIGPYLNSGSFSRFSVPFAIVNNPIGKSDRTLFHISLSFLFFFFQFIMFIIGCIFLNRIILLIVVKHGLRSCRLKITNIFLGDTRSTILKNEGTAIQSFVVEYVIILEGLHDVI